MFPPTFALSHAIYTQDLHDHLGRSRDRIDGGKKKITKSYLIQRLNPLNGGLISPKDISVPLKGSPDLKEGAGLFERKRKEIPRASRTREMDERRSEKRAYSDNTSALWG